MKSYPIIIENKDGRILRKFRGRFQKHKKGQKGEETEANSKTSCTTTFYKVMTMH